MKNTSIAKPQKFSASRRRLARVAAGSVALSGFPAIVRAQTKTITTTAFGGIYEKHYRTHVIEPWEKRSGFKVNLVTTGGADQWLTSAIVNKARPEIDLPFLSLPVTHTAIRTDGIFLDLDEKLIPNSAQIDPLFFDYFDRNKTLSLCSRVRATSDSAGQ